MSFTARSTQLQTIKIIISTRTFKKKGGPSQLHQSSPASWEHKIGTATCSVVQKPKGQGSETKARFLEPKRKCNSVRGSKDRSEDECVYVFLCVLGGAGVGVGGWGW